MKLFEIFMLLIIVFFFLTVFGSQAALLKVERKRKKETYFIFAAWMFLPSLFTMVLKTEIMKTVVVMASLIGCSIHTILATKKILESEKNEQNAQNSLKSVSTTSTKPKKLLPFLAILPFVFGGIFLVFSKIDADKTKEKYKDINGPTNYELNTLTEDDFSTKPYNYLTVGSKHFGKGDATFRDKSEDDEFTEDSDIVTFTANELYGIKIIQETKTDSDTVILDIKNKHKAGNCKIVILVNNKIHQEIKLNSNETVTIEKANNKLIEVVVAGEEACVELEVTREY